MWKTLNIHGIDNLLVAIKHVFASLYNDRAISYRVHKGFSHADVALSAGIQRMVRSDLGAAGVMFSLDTESGFDQVVFITAQLRTGRDGGAGCGQPGRVLCLQDGAERRASGDPASQPRLQGHQDGVYRRARSRPFGAHAGRVRRRSGAASPLPTPRWRSWPAMPMIIEKHYGRPMDIEWGRDGVDGKLYILQARPETVKANDKINSRNATA